MPLVDNAIYAIRNDLTHTVLDLSGDGNFARAWGWNGGYNQKWELIKVDANHWRLQNKLNPHRRFLSRQAANPAHRLVGGVADAHSTFRIERIPGPSERYRILHGGQAVTLIKGGGAEAVAHNILAVHHQVSDRHADGPPIALQAMVDTNHAQIWSFLPVAQLPVEDGTYRIVNQTGLILNSNGAGPVQGLATEQRWTVAKVQNSDYYTFEIGGRFLATPAGAGHDTALTSPTQAQLGGQFQAQAAHFYIRNVPGTQLHKIFFDPTGDVSDLAVNLVGAEVRVLAAEAQTWSFV